MADQQQSNEPAPQTADLIEDPKDEGEQGRSIENEDIQPQTADLIDDPDDGAQGRPEQSGSEHEQGEAMAAPSYSDDEDRLGDQKP